MDPSALSEILAATRRLHEIAQKHGANFAMTSHEHGAAATFHAGAAQPEPVGVTEQLVCGKGADRFVSTRWMAGEVLVSVYSAPLAVAS